MKRSATIALTLAVAAVAIVVVVFQVRVALAVGMSALLNQNAIDAKSQDDYATQRWSVEQMVEWNPHNYHTLYRLGYSYLKTGELDKAREMYEATIQKSPGHLGGLVGLADLYGRAGEFDKARAMAQRALHVAPTSWRATMTAGMVESRARNVDEALTWFEKADRFARAPQPAVYNQIALAHLLNGDGESALHWADRSLAIDDADAEALLAKGKALALLNRYDEAAAACRSAAERSEDGSLAYVDARLHLAGALVEAGRLLEPSEIVRDDVRAAPQEQAVRDTAARVLDRLNAQLAAAEQPADLAGEVQCNIGFAYAAMGMLDDAHVHFKAAELSGADLGAPCIWAHAETLLRLGRAGDAIERYETALAMGPGPPQMRIGYFEALIEAGRIDDARMQHALLTRGVELSEPLRERVDALAERLK